MGLEEWKEKNRDAKSYAHFDKRVALSNVWDYISNPKNIEKHGFYPLIHYEKKFVKYRKNNGKGEKKEKIRKISYSAHIDRYIYSYYGHLLNQKYNEYLSEHDMELVAVAYRDNLKMNNIHFARRAFECIKDSEDCYIIIGDFSDFFDSLDHVYLKRQICDVLKVKSLPKDFYAVYKNITQYSVWELTDLLEFNGFENTSSGIRNLNLLDKVLSSQDFKTEKKRCVKMHRENYGIPQGSAISAVLANVYMIKPDEQINQLATSVNGLYMRYSDDFIIVLPRITDMEFKKVLEGVVDIISSVPRLVLQPEKTQVYKYENKNLNSCNSAFFNSIPNGKNIIEYLGFAFDGNEITIRDKTISKYYYRLYKKMKTIKKSRGYTPKGNRISCKELYENYSIKGARGKYPNGKARGNFLTYVQRAQGIFGENEAIGKKTRRHMMKIRHRLDEVFGKE